MTTIKKTISGVLAAVMLLMLLPVLSRGSGKTAKVPAKDETQRLDTAYSLVLDAIDAENYEDAKAYLKECFALCDPKTNTSMYADLLLKQACIAVIEEKNDIALRALDAALEVQPDLADAFMVRSQICVSQGKIDEAVGNLEHYIELTDDASIYETVAQLYETKGDFAAAQTAYEKYIAGTGGDMDEAGLRAGIYRMQQGKTEEAIAIFEDYLDSEKYGADAAYNIGVCKMSAEDYVGAVEAFDTCIEKGGNIEGIYFNRGICSLEGADWEAAAADFLKSIESEPYADDARYNLGVCQMHMEDYESAAANFTELIGDNNQPELEGQADGTKSDVDDEVYFCRAMCNAMSGNLQAAIADYSTCINRGYELAECYAQRAEVYSALGDTENYNNDLKKAKKYEE